MRSQRHMQRRSISSTPDVLPVCGFCRWWYSENQAAILMALTSVNRDHHHASGFDQAKDLDRAGHSKLMIAPRVTELTLDRSNSVTQTAARPRQKSVVCWLAGRAGWLGGHKADSTEMAAPLSAFGAKRSCNGRDLLRRVKTRLARRDSFPRRRIWWQSDRSGH
jgi:hypothetical protein